jgi:hypothetical protein
MAQSAKPMNVRRKMLTARSREVEFSNGGGREVHGKFINWLRGKFGESSSERHGTKPPEIKAGKPYTRVQHRTGGGR